MADAILVANSFASYKLTPEQETAGAVLTTTQQQVIQNQIAAIAEQKLALEYNPDAALAFAQQEAYLRGQLDILQYLLDTSTTITAEYPITLED